MKGEKQPIKIIKENILRVMVEETDGLESIERVRELSKHPIIPESTISDLDKYFIKGLKELQESGLIDIKNESICITKKGQIEGNKIFTKHLSIENYFLKKLDAQQAHKAAHLLEHLISKEVIKNLNRLNSIEGYGIPLNDFKSSEGVISDLKIEDTQLFERLISMGVCPGQRIKIIARLTHSIVVKLRNTQIAIDNCICNGIMVVME